MQPVQEQLLNLEQVIMGGIIMALVVMVMAPEELTAVQEEVATQEVKVPRQTPRWPPAGAASRVLFSSTAECSNNDRVAQALLH